MGKKLIRIFVSSPHDVQYERNIAKNVIREIGELYSRYVDLEIVMWEDLPLTSDTTFQEGIDYFLKEKPIDVAVFILWTRLGTPLCNKFRKADGTCYKSGTEYEFDMMMQLHNESSDHSPRILTYIKDSESLPPVRNLDEMKDYIAQKDLLAAFIKEHFRDEESNSNYAYMQFGESTSFEQKFKTHLTTAIKSMVGEVKEIREWEGNPYVGLNSFEFEHSSIFYGRRKLVYETASKLVDITKTENLNSLIVLGESGSGKSSFLKAGLLPFFCSDKSNGCSYITITPSQFASKLYDGLISELVSFYPFLRENPFIEEISNGIKSQDNYNHLRYALDQHLHKSLVICVDQFEEIFDDGLYTEEERKKAIHLLLGLVSTRRIHVFISMRSDFYYWFSREQELQKLKSECLIVDIPSVDVSEITEIIEEPARKAALSWEIDSNGDSLNKQIITDAMRIKELPLIEFALSELYKQRDEKGCLTFEAYDRIGRLEGAVVKYANDFYNKLSKDEKTSFADLLSFVIAESSSNKGNYIRKTSLRTDAEKDTVSASLIDKLIKSHLFISGRDSLGNATITIVHEMLILSWNVISQWVNTEKEFLDRNGYYERLAHYWTEAGKSSRKLVSGRTPLLEVEYHLFKNHNRLSFDVQKFLEASIKKEKRKGLGWRIAVLVVYILFLIVLIFENITGLWKELDSDFVEWCGVNNLNAIDVITIFGAILFVLVHSILLRIKGQSEYKIIKHSFYVWLLAFVLLIIDTIYTTILTGEFWDAFLGMIPLLIPVTIILVSKFREYLRRRKWSNSYVPYLWSDDTMFKVKTYSVFSFIVIYILLYSIIFFGTIEEKEEKLNQRAETADLLFEGLEKTKETLSGADLIVINKQRMEYLKTNFKDELKDTICDDRELEYAQCLLNMGWPKDACTYLYPNERYDHLLFWVICESTAGIYDQIGSGIENYMQDGNRYDEVGAYSTGNLIWPAEKVGRFDLAERIYDIVRDTMPDNLNHPSYIVNNAHICLSKGETDEAVSMYCNAMKTANYYGSSSDFVKQSIQNDFYIFSRESVIPNDVLEVACRKMGIKFEPAVVTKSDTLLNDIYWPRLIGTWKWESSEGYSVFMTFKENVPYITYSVYNSQETNYSRQASDVRISKDKNGQIIWEELNLYNEYHSHGMLLSVEDDYFELQVINNHNPDEKGQVRKYIKQTEE